MSILNNETVRGVQDEYLYADRVYATVNMPRMINIKDPSNEWASFLGKVFLGLVIGISFLAFCFNAFFGSNI